MNNFIQQNRKQEFFSKAEDFADEVIMIHYKRQIFIILFHYTFSFFGVPKRYYRPLLVHVLYQHSLKMVFVCGYNGQNNVII